MKILGIPLKTPDMPSLLATSFLGVVACAVTAALILTEVATVHNGVAIATGMIGSSLANAYGVSVKDSGLRGAVVLSVFSLALMALVRSLMLLGN